MTNKLSTSRLVRVSTSLPSRGVCPAMSEPGVVQDPPPYRTPIPVVVIPDAPTDFFWASTQLVLPLDYDAVDYSPNASPVTWHGGAALTTTRSRYGTHAYEGNADPASSLRVAPVFAYPAGTNWQLEVQAFFTTKAVDQVLLHMPGIFSLRYIASIDNILLSDPPTEGSSAFSRLDVSPTVGQWLHLAITYRGWNGTNQCKYSHRDGLHDGMGCGAGAVGNFAFQPLWIGGDGVSPFLGGLSQVRVTNIPVAEFRMYQGESYEVPPLALPRTFHPAVSCKNGAGVSRSAYVRGAATPSPTQFVSPPQSIYIPRRVSGNSSLDGLVIEAHSDFNFGTQDFRIKFSAYRIAGALDTTLFECTANGDLMRLFFGDAANTRRFNGRWASSGGSTATAGYLPQAMPEGAWTTLEMRRVGADFQLLQDDVVIETRAVPGGAGATVNITSDLFFGCRATSSNGSLNGYIDDIEVYRGETLVASLSGETLG